MYDAVRTQRFARLERGLGDESSRTFTLRKFEGIPQYTGELRPMGLCSRRDSDDLAVMHRRSPTPSSGCRYVRLLLLVTTVVLGLVCTQFVFNVPTRLVGRSLGQSERCPVCTCGTNST